ncbi:MAG: Gfo/Idh/MocA family oxidoreductase [Phycisphaeraceae bacterium]|nr:Gfo/Idh/MocA family oxidoreductase [Phycisphaeraceae bacterium]
MAKVSKKLRVAFIGSGGISGAHLKHLVKMDDVEVVALADIDPKALKARSSEFGIDPVGCFADWKTMLRKVKPDAVSVCTPNGVHAPATIDALKAGADVLVEKPMAATLTDARRMVQTARKAGRKLVIGFQYRYAAKTAFLRKSVDEGQFGKVIYGRVQALRRRGIPNWGVFYSKEAQGGGPLIDIGVHVLEMAHYAMGSPKPVAATGRTFTYLGNKDSLAVECAWKGWNHKKLDIEDLAVGQIRFENGAVLTVEASFAAHIEKDIWSFDLLGEKAGGRWEPPGIFTDQAGHMVNLQPSWLPRDGFDEIFGRKMRNWVEHCLYNKPTLAPAEDGLAVQCMLDAIYASAARGGREVAIKA